MNLEIIHQKGLTSEIISDKNVSLNLNNEFIDLSIDSPKNFILGLEVLSDVNFNVDDITLELQLEQPPKIVFEISHNEPNYQFTTNFIAGGRGPQGPKGDTGLSNYAYVKILSAGYEVDILQSEHLVERVSSVIGLNLFGEEVSLYYIIDSNETVKIKSNVSLENLSLRIS